MELTHCLGLKPRDAVPEITIKDRESLLWQKPCAGNVDLQRKAAALGIKSYIHKKNITSSVRLMM
jgi:hypothetical protein